MVKAVTKYLLGSESLGGSVAAMEEINLPNRDFFSRKYIFLYSLIFNFIIAPLLVLGFYNLYMVPNSSGVQNKVSVLELFSSLGTSAGSTILLTSSFWTIYLFGFWLFVRWLAATAEQSGRSYVGFMILAIFCAPIAWIIVLTFKKSTIDDN